MIITPPITINYELVFSNQDIIQYGDSFSSYTLNRVLTSFWNKQNIKSAYYGMNSAVDRFLINNNNNNRFSATSYELVHSPNTFISFPNRGNLELEIGDSFELRSVPQRVLDWQIIKFDLSQNKYVEGDNVTSTNLVYQASSYQIVAGVRWADTQQEGIDLTILSDGSWSYFGWSSNTNPTYPLDKVFTWDKMIEFPFNEPVDLIIWYLAVEGLPEDQMSYHFSRMSELGSHISDKQIFITPHWHRVDNLPEDQWDNYFLQAHRLASQYFDGAISLYQLDPVHRPEYLDSLVLHPNTEGAMYYADLLDRSINAYVKCDYNNDTNTDVFDIVEFFNKFSQGDPIADRERSFGFDIFDIFHFFQTFAINDGGN